MRARLILVGVLCASTLRTGASAEQPAPARPSTHRPTDGTRRLRVELSVWGKLSERDSSTLFGLLTQELSANGLVLVPTQSVPNSAAGFALAGGAPPALMRVALDVRSPSDWSIVIVDVARKRSLVRTQRGPARNAAALEATVSIVAAAGVALHEGFEITPSPAPAPPPVAATQSQPPTPLQVFSTFGVSLATFESHVPLQLGPAAALGLRLRELVALRLVASHFFDEHFDSRFGSFDLDRSHLALSGGPCWSNGWLEGELALGVATELLRRRNAKPATGVTASSSSDVFRTGAAAEARIRFRIFDALALELSAGAAYFPASLRFSAQTGANSVLAAPFRLVGLGGVGLELRAP